MSDKKFISCLLIILLVGIVFRVWNFTPALGNDDQRWVLTAQEFGEQRSTEIRPVYYTRVLWRALLAGWGSVAGLTLSTTPWLMFGLSCITTIAIALAGRVAYGPSVGLWAAAVYATHPLALVYDTLTLPDGLAQAMLATNLYMFLKFLRTDRPGWLLGCGLGVGLSASAKGYFILAAVPIAVCLLLREEAFRTKLRQATLFSSLVVAGLAVGMVLCYWDSGNPLSMFPGVSEYGERILARQQGNSNVGFQRLARQTMERFRYLQWLFVDMGMVSGFISLWAFAVMCLKSSRCSSCLLLSTMTAMYFLFLFFFPAKLHPFTFVEMQPRYLGVLLPMLAIGSGLTLATAEKKLPSSAVRRALLATLLLGLLSNVMVPNDLGNRTFNRSDRQELNGIHHLLANAQNDGVTELVFPNTGYLQTSPASLHSFGVTISYYDADDAEAAEQIKSRLMNDSGSILFIPRSGFSWPLVHALRRGEYHKGMETDPSYKELISWLESNTFSRQGMLVPDTVFMEWMSWGGLVSREQQLVGWTYRKQLDNSKP